MRAIRTRRSAEGMSMVELMVAMAIALIGTIIIFQVFEVSEGIRRTTTSGGDAQQNGVIGLYVIENDLRNAGMGINDTSYAGCSARAYDSGRLPTAYTIPILPASITGGGSATAPDQLAIFYGSQYRVADSTTITKAMTSGLDDIKVVATGRYGYRTGDLVLMMQPATTLCELMEVTALPGDPEADIFKHAPGTAYNLTVQGLPVGTTSRFNPAGGSQIFAGTGTLASRAFNIGNPYDPTSGAFSWTSANAPVFNTYKINANTLTSTSLFSNVEQPIADNVVHMRALYGLDDGGNNGTVPYNTVWVQGDSIVDRFVDAATFAGLPATKYQYLAAVRVVLVARSALPEKPSGGAGAPCDTTNVAPSWSGTAWDAANSATNGGLTFQTELDLSANTDWKCYRYKTFETTIPLRNWLWKSS
jgi:type IV pilus assembly protein PilW